MPTADSGSHDSTSSEGQSSTNNDEDDEVEDEDDEEEAGGEQPAGIVVQVDCDDDGDSDYDLQDDWPRLTQLPLGSMQPRDHPLCYPAPLFARWWPEAGSMYTEDAADAGAAPCCALAGWPVPCASGHACLLLRGQPGCPGR